MKDKKVTILYVLLFATFLVGWFGYTTRYEFSPLSYIEYDSGTSKIVVNHGDGEGEKTLGEGAGGGGGFDYPFDDYKGKAEDYPDISSWKTGNNVNIQGGGTLVGTLSKSTLSGEFYDAVNSKAIWKYLGVAGNETNDYVCLPDISIPNSARNSGSNYLDVLSKRSTGRVSITINWTGICIALLVAVSASSLITLAWML